MKIQPAVGDKRTCLFDSHLHIIDPRFPLVPNQGYLPPFFTLADYHARTANFRVLGGAVVSGSFQAFDQSYLLTALRELGPTFVGVTQLPAGASDAQILELAESGVRAVRFNLYRGGSEGIDALEEMARRVFALAGWHVELYIAAHDLAELTPRLLTLPCVSIDHLGLTAESLPYLLQLVEHGARVKATGFGRCDFAIEEVLRAIYQANPGALIFGTDLPSTRVSRPFADADVETVLSVLGEEAGHQVLYENASAFYRLA